MCKDFTTKQALIAVLAYGQGKLVR